MNRAVRWIEDRPRVHAALAPLVSSGLLVALLAVSGCGSGTVGGEDSAKPRETPTRAIDAQGLKACNTFALWLADEEPASTRQDVAVKVDKQASTSKSGELADKAELLAKSDVIQSNENWALAADSFAYECQQLGWTAADAR